VSGSPDDLILLRWFLAQPGRPVFRGAEEIVRDAVSSAVAALETFGALESFYLSKQGGREVWLTAFLPRHASIPAIDTVEPYLRSVCFRTGHLDDPTKDQILGDSCRQFRRCVHTMTRIGLDLHGADLEACQRELVAIGCVGRNDRARLEQLLLSHSPTYSALADREAFWGSFGSNCLQGQNTDCGHWLYNVVLGLDWFEGQSESSVLRQLGLSETET